MKLKGKVNFVSKVRWGIVGPGKIAVNFAQGLHECESGELCGVASRNKAKASAFGCEFNIATEKCYSSYEELFADGDIDAVYIATPHPFHAQIAITALRAGKHVLVEKPAGIIPGEVITMTDVAMQEGRFLMEGLMYRCHPQISRVLEVIQSGEIGKITHIDASFGFASLYNENSRLDNPFLAGGAILDVGVYPISFARLIAGAAQGKAHSEPLKISGAGLTNALGVDETAYATLVFGNGITASCSSSIRREMENSATITGTDGMIFLDNPWVPGRNEAPSNTNIRISSKHGERVEHIISPWMLFRHEAELASQMIITGKLQAQSPAPSWSDSIGNSTAVTAWRSQVILDSPAQSQNTTTKLVGTLPEKTPIIPRLKIEGMQGEITSLIVGCDNKDSVDEAAIVWDAWWNAGGNSFDTSFVYGGGAHEKILGEWMASRGVSKEARVIVKGAHSPYCVPDAIAVQLEISLERLRLDHAPIYIMHRDNLDVPISEFIGVLNDLKSRGLIGAFGGSNWSVGRFQEACLYAQKNKLIAPKILNNNLSLAVMEKPVWPGCVTSNNSATLDFLRSSDTTHVSWSSQARGYFLDPGQGTELSKDTRPDVCFSSKNNSERRSRAQKLAKEKGVEPHTIATAWVLNQSFQSLALIGPRTANEIYSTLKAAKVILTDRECKWLNLEL